MRPFIVIGDSTDHGGSVVEAAGTTDTHGKRIARVGDKVTCPKRNHGPTTIVTGDPTMLIDGKAAARHGDLCACGARLIASQYVSFTHDGAGPHQETAAALATAAPVAERRTLFPFDEQVELRANTAFAEGLPYFIEVGGRIYSGRVGPDGRLPRINTTAEDDYVLHVGDEALSLMQGAQT